MSNLAGKGTIYGGLAFVNEANVFSQPQRFNGAVGINAAPPTDALMLIGGTVNNTVAPTFALDIDTIFTGTANQPIGLQLDPTFQPSANITGARALSSAPVIDLGAGRTLINAVGINSSITTLSGGGTLTNLINIVAAAPTYGTVLPSNAYAFQAQNHGAAGISNAYGMYIANQSGATNNYGIYCLHTGTNFIGGNLAVGNAGVVFTPGQVIDVHSASTNLIGATNTGAQSTSGGAFFIANADPGAAMLAGNRLGVLAVGGAVNATHTIINSFGLVAFTAENFGAAAAGTDMAIELCNIGAITRTERMRITARGNMVMGAQAALATTATDGFLYIPTCAGVPTGVPTAYAGMVPLIYDTVNSRLYAYNGGWVIH